MVNFYKWFIHTFQSVFSNCWVQSLINHNCCSSFLNSYCPLGDLSMTGILKFSTIMKLFYFCDSFYT